MREEISKGSAIKIIYYLMAADGEISQAEVEKFDLIAKELDEDFDKYKKRLISDCQNQLNEMIDEDEYYDVVQEGVQNAIIEGRRGGSVLDRYAMYGLLGETKPSGGGYGYYGFEKVSAKVVVWDLLTIAVSDGKYSKEERKLIKYVVRMLGIDKTLFLEMENSIKAIAALDQEEKWIKTTDRSYMTIESQIKELETRRNVIENSVKELILRDYEMDD